MRKGDRRAIFRHTMECVDNYDWEPATLFKESDIGDNPGREGRIIFYNGDTFEVAVNYDNAVVLNMASNTHYGGGVGGGSSAQEESLCRRSTLFPSLKAAAEHYPLPDNGGLYCKSRVFKSTEAKGCKNIKDFQVGVLSMAAIKNPQTRHGPLTEGNARRMSIKVRNLLRKAIAEGHTTIVLGAWGCGAYHNPPKHVAQIMRREVNKVKSYFDTIVFAILRKGYDTHDNYAIFEAEFNEKINLS